MPVVVQESFPLSQVCPHGWVITLIVEVLKLLSRSFSVFSSIEIVGGGLIDIPILISINASNTFHFFSSTGLCNLAVFSGHKDHLGTTRLLALTIHWTISFPSVTSSGAQDLSKDFTVVEKTVVCS